MTVFIPSRDRDGQSVGQELCIDECLRTLGTLFRGGTAFPPGKGVWRDDERGGALLFEPVVMVVSYADAAEVTDASLLTLRSFLHRMGREARQGEVGLVVDGDYWFDTLDSVGCAPRTQPTESKLTHHHLGIQQFDVETRA